MTQTTEDRMALIEKSRKRKKNPLNKLTRGIGGLASGAAKGFGSTVLGGAQLLQRGALKGAEALGAEDAASHLRRQIVKTEKGQESLKPETGAEKAGFTIEQFAEFLIPGSAALKGQKALKGTKLVSKLPKSLQSVVPAVATEAGAFGAMQAVQEGEIDQETAIASAIAGAFPIAGAATAPLREKIKQVFTEKISPKIINSLIKPGKKEFSFGKNPGKAVLDEKIVANTVDELNDKIRTKLSGIGSEIQRQAATGAEKTNAKQIIDDFLKKNADDISEKLLDEGGERRFQRVIDRLMETEGLEGLSGSGLHQLQQRIGRMTQWSGQPYEKEVNQLLAKLYRQVGVRLNQVSPGTKQLQTRYSNLLAAQKAAERRAGTVARANAIFNLSPTLLGGATGIGTVLSGGDLGDASTNALLSMIITKGAGTAAVKTRAAKILNEIGKKEISDQKRQALTSELIKLLSESTGKQEASSQ